jgi:ribose-phosphate pyrophosphokinase
MQIFTGNSNPNLAKSVARYFGGLNNITVGKFSDGEIYIELPENVRGQDVFIIQSTCSPTNDHIMELMLMVDALKRASAKSISAVIPYFGYARQDRRPRSARVPISARVVANMLSQAGISRLLTIELHADQIQGFFDIPVDNIYSTRQFADDIKELDLPNLVIVSPDVGGVLRARSLAKQLGDSDLVIIDKRRPAHNVSEVMNIIGDVVGKNCIIVDDLVDTGGTLCKAVQAIMDRGAESVRAYCTHAVLSGNALKNFRSTPITELIVTDTIPLKPAMFDLPIRQISVAELLAESIRRIEMGYSLKSLG